MFNKAIIYTCHLPVAEALADHLASKKFVAPLASELNSYGFQYLPHSDSEYVVEFPGGYMFDFRIDSKIMPAAAVNKILQERIDEIRKQEGRRVGRKEKQTLKENIVGELCATALVKSTLVRCFYHTDSNTLIVAANRKDAQFAVHALISAVESVKFESIVIDGLKRGITACLESYLAGSDDAFGQLEINGAVSLKGKGSAATSLSVKRASLRDSKEGLEQVIAAGFEVASVALSDGSVSFTLKDDFALTGIKFEYDSKDVDADDMLEYAKHEASACILMFAEVLKELKLIFGYKPKAD